MSESVFPALPPERVQLLEELQADIEVYANRVLALAGLDGALHLMDFVVVMHHRSLDADGTIHDVYSVANSPRNAPHTIKGLLLEGVDVIDEGQRAEDDDE